MITYSGTEHALQVIIGCKAFHESSFPNLHEGAIMDTDHQQSNARRRLSFDDDDTEMQDASMLPREGDEERDASLPRDGGVQEPGSPELSCETDTESISSEEEGVVPRGVRILYEGPPRHARLRQPPVGHATIIARIGRDLTRMASIPIDRLHVAVNQGEQSETESDSERDEGNDRQGGQ